ncbi:hypothetical protein MLD38_040322 [Melastoma candidum]|uniref:Uncharacterized protein n=1 Tax=Melastoma candidum TaxID=119954 RepID=A0ACB9L5N2_9MYRT|nr:hypothetical protein MLD38_040322 [Melastoma candidum]
MMLDCCCCSHLGDRICAFLHDYDRLQSLAVSLIYLQIACALVGSLAASYNGVLLINLSIALFALVAIVSSSQTLGRTYVVLLVCAMLLDVSWFILFSHDIWVISSDHYGVFYIFSVKLALVMEIIGFSVRLISSLLWIQMYRLGISNVDIAYPSIQDDDLRNNLLSPTTTTNPDEVLTGSIYDPVSYSSLFEDGQVIERLNRIHQTASGEGFTPSPSGNSQSKPSPGRFFQAVKVDISKAKLPGSQISKTNSV